MKAKGFLALALVLVLCIPFIAYASGFDTTVYITDTGSKYHQAGCASLWNSSHAVSLQQAINAGYEPCMRCSPPYNAAPMPTNTKSIEERIQDARNSTPQPTKTPDTSGDKDKTKAPEWLAIILGIGFGTPVGWIVIFYLVENIIDSVRYRRKKSRD